MPESNEPSAEWLRAKCEAASEIHKTICQAAVHSEEAMGIAYTWSDAAEVASDHEDHHRALLAAAEAHEARENAAEISADRAWIDGAKFGWNCETKTDLREAIANRQQQIREATPAPEVIHGVRESLDALGIRPDSLSETVEKLREACSGVRVEPEPDAPTAAQVIEAAEKALERLLPWALQAGANAEDALALCARWKEANGDGANTR